LGRKNSGTVNELVTGCTKVMKWTKQQTIQYGTVQQSRKPFKCTEWELLDTDLKKSTSKAGKLFM
jgi:hypothetical protein